MISNKQRREVAEKIRKIAYSEPGWALDSLIVAAITSSISAMRQPLSETLADLIDRPTCRNVSGHRDEFECSECRCKVESLTEVCNERGEIFRVPFMPKYCPNCDAEVVDDD